MPAAGEIEFVLPGPIGGMNRRTYPTELPDDNFLTLKNLEIAEGLGAFITRKGTTAYNSALIDAGGDGPIRGGIRAYYTGGARMIVATNTKLWRDNGAGGFNSLETGLTSAKQWYFASYEDAAYGVNGADAPRRVNLATNTVRLMGFIAPVAAPTVAAAGGLGVLTGNYKYKITFVYDGMSHHESNGGPESLLLGLTNQNGSLTGIPLGGSGCTARNVYRTKTDGTTFYYVGQIADNVTTVYTDSTLDTALGTNLCPSDNNPPPVGAEKIINWRGRMVVAKGKRLHFSAINSTEKSPDGSSSIHGASVEIFPTLHYIDVGDDNSNVVQMGVVNDILVIFKEDQIFNITGDTGQDIRSWKAQSATGCIAPRSVVDMNGLLFFLGRSEGGPMVYSYNGSAADPASLPLEPYFIDFIYALGDPVTQPVQPCATRYRGRYMLCYRNAQTFAYEIAELDLRPPQARWTIHSNIDASVFIPWYGPGDSGELYYGHTTEARVLRFDTKATEYNSVTPFAVTALVETGWMHLKAPYQQKQIHTIEIYCKIGEQPGVCDPQPGDTLITCSRYYDFGTTPRTSGCLNYNVTTARKITSGAQLCKIKIPCQGSDATNPDRGYLMKLLLTWTGPLEIHRVVIHATPESAWRAHHQT